MAESETGEPETGQPETGAPETGAPEIGALERREPAAGAGVAPPVPAVRAARRYYSIREVGELLGVKPHVLRYWETQFPPLRPRKSRGGARMYQENDLDVLRSIREMLHERGYTIAGARQRLLEERRKAAPEPQIQLDFVPPKERRRWREIRDDLSDLLGVLQGPPGARDPRARRGRAEPESDGGADRGGAGARGRRDISVDPGGTPG